MKKILIVLAMIIPLLSSAQTKIGIGIANPADTLDINGSANFRGVIKLGSSAGLKNQVLMSRGTSGNPQWKYTAYDGGGRFLVTLNSNYVGGSPVGRGNFNLTGGTQQEDSLDFQTGLHAGNDFSLHVVDMTNNYITVNRSGLYHFEGSLRLIVSSASTVNMYPRATVRFKANQIIGTNMNIVLASEAMSKESGPEVGGGANSYFYSPRFSFDIHLNAGTTCTFLAGVENLRFPDNTPLAELGQVFGGYISGYFVAE